MTFVIFILNIHKRVKCSNKSGEHDPLITIVSIVYTFVPDSHSCRSNAPKETLLLPPR